MGWVERLMDERYTLVRLVLLDLSGVGYLLFGHGGRAPADQWGFAVVAFVSILALHRLPFVNVVTQTAVLVAAMVFIDDTTINEVGVGWALFELALRTLPRWQLVTGVVGVGTVFAIAGGVEASLRGVGVLLLTFAVQIALPVLVGINVRTAREHAAADRLRRESEMRAARSAERSAIARELHDVVAHHVASMVLRVGVARHVLPDADPRVVEVFDDVHATGTAALADLRQLVGVLRDPSAVKDAALTAIEPSALPAALGAAVEIARRTGLTVDADIAAEVAALDAVRGLAVLRLTQEALTNVAKHAGPSASVRLRVAVDDGAVRWEVEDDGGSAPRPPVGGGGHGLTGMRERVEVLGGRLEAGPHGPGWRLRTTLP